MIYYSHEEIVVPHWWVIKSSLCDKIVGNESLRNRPSFNYKDERTKKEIKKWKTFKAGYYGGNWQLASSLSYPFVNLGWSVVGLFFFFAFCIRVCEVQLQLEDTGRNGSLRPSDMTVSPWARWPMESFIVFWPLRCYVTFVIYLWEHFLCFQLNWTIYCSHRVEGCFSD